MYWLAVLLTLVVGTAVLACGTSAPEPAATPAQSPVNIQPPATVETAAANPQPQAESVTDPTPIVVPAPVGGGPSKEELAAVFSPNSSRASDTADNPPKPESTDGKRAAGSGRDQKVLLCIWDNGFRERKPTRNKEHPTDATT